MTLPEIMAIHPAPWRHQAQGGTIRVLDAKGQQVQLFTVLDFVINATAQLATQPVPASASA
jgi:hypothetical protein